MDPWQTQLGLLIKLFPFNPDLLEANGLCERIGIMAILLVPVRIYKMKRRCTNSYFWRIGSYNLVMAVQPCHGCNYVVVSLCYLKGKLTVTVVHER